MKLQLTQEAKDYIKDLDNTITTMKKQDLIYITFNANSDQLQFQKDWFVLCDKKGITFNNIDTAYKYASNRYGDRIYFGVAEYDQMILNNAQRDNF